MFITQRWSLFTFYIRHKNCNHKRSRIMFNLCPNIFSFFIFDKINTYVATLCYIAKVYKNTEYFSYESQFTLLYNIALDMRMGYITIMLVSQWDTTNTYTYPGIRVGNVKTHTSSEKKMYFHQWYMTINENILLDVQFFSLKLFDSCVYIIHVYNVVYTNVSKYTYIHILRTIFPFSEWLSMCCYNKA